MADVNRSFPRRLGSPDPDDILRELSTRQHLVPHRPVGEALAAAAAEAGFCPAAAERALGWLQIDPAAKIGRLRRSELAQLAHSIYRFRRSSPAADAPASQWV